MWCFIVCSRRWGLCCRREFAWPGKYLDFYSVTEAGTRCVLPATMIEDGTSRSKQRLSVCIWHTAACRGMVGEHRLYSRKRTFSDLGAMGGCRPVAAGR